MWTGDTIGKYRLVTRLGRGGMGEVWLAKASGYGGFTKTVVLKTLLPELASDPLFVELLAREAKICATLSHPNLIEVFDFTEHAGVHLLAMEYVLGQPLNAIMRAAHERGWSIPPWFALRIAWDCCCGLQFAHEQGVIHCDLSPSNVMVTYTGATKVLDFGVAHTRALGEKSDRLKGKYAYMAPERIRTRATDQRTDIYALGVMLYLLFTGQLPFASESDAELLYRITNDKVISPSALVQIEPTMEHVILRAMHPNPAQRFQSIAEVLEALAPCLEGKLGTYGQQHAAGFVNALFGAEPEPVAEDTQPVEEIEIVVDTGAHGIPRGQLNDTSTAQLVRPLSPPPPPLPKSRTRPMGSVEMVPIPKPPKRPKPLIAAFAQASLHTEPKTSVQSLFGERPQASSSISGLFARGTRETVDPSRPAAVIPEPRDEPDLPERTSGVFGAYSGRRAAPEAVWPWPTSRSKPE